MISIKYPDSTLNTSKSKLEKISRIFSINPANQIKEVRFNTWESYDLAHEIDTDREIIDSIKNPKYWDNFNVTFDDEAFGKQKRKKSIKTKSRSHSRKKIKQNCTISSFKKEYSQNKKVKNLVDSLAKDLGTSKRHAYIQIYNHRKPFYPTPSFTNLPKIWREKSSSLSFLKIKIKSTYFS